MNLKQLMHGEYLTARLYKYNHETNEYFTPISFKYKTYDDTQYREARTHPQAGNLSSKFSLSIKTTANIDVEVKDKITLDTHDKKMEVTGVQKLYDAPTSILNLLLPKTKGNVPTIIHLNKDDV